MSVMDRSMGNLIGEAAHNIDRLDYKEGGSMHFVSRTFKVVTEKGPQFIDITDRVKKVVVEASIKNGFIIVFSKHTTAAIRINENEPALIHDMEEMLERLAPAQANIVIIDMLTPSPTTGNGRTATPTANNSSWVLAKPYPSSMVRCSAGSGSGSF